MIGVHQLTKRFDAGNHPILAVDQISFDVRESEVYGLLGPNGAGKTTTLRMVLGLLAPTSGYAEINGIRTDRSDGELRRCIGLVSASANLYQWLTPRETLLYFADLYGISPEYARDAVTRLSEQFGLMDFLDRRCSVLSTGQKQRVQLARALIHDPPVMLLDEPTRGLDVIGTQGIFEFIGHLRTLGKAVIVCTHRLDEAERLCDRFGLLHQGKMVIEGTLDELKTKTSQTGLMEMFLHLAEIPAIVNTPHNPLES
ncbi:MAG: ATP-binding cassette domain-containing protein [Planctomycetota bacterium]|nr:ATP-binding cassette domain-containing protein [Planctomycetota bacterium]MDA1211953.1 ATP-binding cassette domain-containing protein [Planctomycetota bacterium]